MKILRQGRPIGLVGLCGACNSVIETDASEAPSHPGLPNGSPVFYCACPVCEHRVYLSWAPLCVDGTWYRPGQPPTHA